MESSFPGSHSPSLWSFNGRVPRMTPGISAILFQFLFRFEYAIGCIVEMNRAAFLSRIEKENPIGMLAISPSRGDIARVGAALDIDDVREVEETEKVIKQ